MDRTLGRCLVRYGTRLLAGGRRPDHFADACKALTLAVRAHKRLIKLMPEYFDPRARSERERHEEQERWIKTEIEPILERVYAGPSISQRK